MQANTLPLIQTNLLHPLAKDYLQQEEKLHFFYQYAPDPDGIAKAIADRKQIVTNRKLLSERLLAQYLQMDGDFSGKEENNAVINAINSLKNHDTFTVTTGHQLNIFTGPLFFIYKIISTINYAKWLKEKFPAQEFVPVYWMATEDHDLEEINHINLFGRKFQWEAKAAGAVGRMDPQSLAEQISYIGDLIANREEGQELIKLFKKAYLSQPTLSLATRAIVHELFKDEGLLIIDADDVELKREFIPVLKRELLDQISENAIGNSVQQLEKDYKLPVNPRSINLFYLTESKRLRIDKNKEGNYFADAEKNWTEKEILQELQESPQNFSPNVVLRPVYQEKILPNLAYIGGNNEIAYWLELKSAFEDFGVFYPQLLVRDSAIWIGKKFAKELAQMKLEPKDLLLPFENLKNLFYQKNELQHPAEEQLDILIDETEALKEKVQGLPPSLASAIVQQGNQHVKDLKKLKKELKKQREEEHEKVLQKLEKIYQSVYPSGSFQERYDNFIPYYLQYGPNFYQLLKDHFNPIDGSIKIFSEKY